MNWTKELAEEFRGQTGRYPKGYKPMTEPKRSFTEKERAAVRINTQSYGDLPVPEGASPYPQSFVATSDSSLFGMGSLAKKKNERQPTEYEILSNKPNKTLADSVKLGLAPRARQLSMREESTRYLVDSGVLTEREGHELLAGIYSKKTPKNKEDLLQKLLNIREKSQTVLTDDKLRAGIDLWVNQELENLIKEKSVNSIYGPPAPPEKKKIEGF